MSIIKGTNQIVAGFGGTKRSIGEVYFSQSSLATDNSGALPLFTGETIASANTIYPDFYNWVLAHTELQCTSAEYESALSTYGECPKYVIGDGSLRLPKRALSHGTVIKEKKPTEADPTWYRQWSDGWLEQGGIVAGNGVYGLTTVTLLKPYSSVNYSVTANILWGTDWYTNTFNVNAQAFTDAASIPTNYTTTSFALQAYSSHKWEAKGMGADGAQEDTLYPWVVAYTAAIPSSTAQAAEFQQGLSGKANTDLSNVPLNYDYIVEQETLSDGSWYRKYKSGWLEQGNSSPTGDQGFTLNKTINFPKPFADNTYMLVGPGFYIANAGAQTITRTATGFTTSSVSNLTGCAYWYACGQGA